MTNEEYQAEVLRVTKSIVETIKDYRRGEIAESDVNHVKKWAAQFTPTCPLSFLKEVDYTLNITFLTREKIVQFLTRLVKNPDLTGGNHLDYWSKAHILKIQLHGHSQIEMYDVFAECLMKELGLDIEDCGQEGGDYIYLDDVMFSGTRVRKDFERFVDQMPKKSKIQIIVAVCHSSANYYLRTNFFPKLDDSSVFKIWSVATFENRKYYKNTSDVLWPYDMLSANEEVANYIDTNSLDFAPRSNVGSVGDHSLFSSPDGRVLLESEFLKAGVKILSQIDNVKGFQRPLGQGFFGLGFGSMIVTYRNCPNNAPLALWWGDPDATSGALNWYPLLPRKTYSGFENIFGAIDFGNDW